MSEPKRYDRRDIYDVTYQARGDECLPEPSENGEFVMYSDYASLKAENARIRKLFADTERLMLLDGEYEAVKVGTFTYFKDLVERLSDENARLRFAGDMLADCLDGSITCLDHDDVISRWKAEKGGLQS